MYIRYKPDIVNYKPVNFLSNTKQGWDWVIFNSVTADWLNWLGSNIVYQYYKYNKQTNCLVQFVLYVPNVWIMMRFYILCHPYNSIQYQTWKSCTHQTCQNSSGFGGNVVKTTINLNIIFLLKYQVKSSKTSSKNIIFSCKIWNVYFCRKVGIV